MPTTALFLNGTPVELLADHVTGWKVRRGGSPGYARVRVLSGPNTGKVWSMRRDLLEVRVVHPHHPEGFCTVASCDYSQALLARLRSEKLAG